MRAVAARAGFGARPSAQRPSAIWRPALALAALCAVLALLAYGLVGRHIGQVAVTRHTVLTVAIVLLLDVLVVTGVLTLASNHTGRTLVLGAGGLCALVSTTFVLGGAPLGLGTSVICLVVIGMGARQSMHSVEDGSVHVTVLPGGRQRTLSPGLNLLMPGERVLAVLSTRTNTHQTLTERVSLPNGLEAEAAITIQYALMAEHAERAIAGARDWERALRGHTKTILREELSDFLAASGPSDAPTGERALAPATPTPSPASATDSAAIDELRARLRSRLRHEFAAQGVEVLTVEVHDAILPAPVLSFWHNAPTAAREAARDVAKRPAQAQPAEPPPVSSSVPRAPVPALAPPIAGSMPRRTPFDHEPGQGVQAYINGFQERLGGLINGWRRLVRPEQASTAPDVAVPARTMPPPPAGVAPTPSNDDASAPHVATAARPLSARTLAAMYEAVQEERINDPETVRRVADALGQYVPAPDEEYELPFDSHAAATDLLSRLAQHAQPPDADTVSDDPANDASARESQPDGPARSPRPPSDENILRGG